MVKSSCAQINCKEFSQLLIKRKLKSCGQFALLVGKLEPFDLFMQA